MSIWLRDSFLGGVVLRENVPFIASLTTRELPGFTGVCLECRYREQFYADHLFAALGVHFPEQIRAAAAIRKAAFLAGRLAAQHGFRVLGVPKQVVGIGPNGEPLWPEAVSASISHTAGNHPTGVAICILSWGRHRVGVDVEDFLSAAVLSEVKELILTPAEQRYIATLNGKECQVATILFSGKECLYKALYPEVRAYFDFLDAEAIKLDFTNSQITFCLVKALSLSLPPGTRVVIAWQVGEEEVVTYVPLAGAGKGLT